MIVRVSHLEAFRRWRDSDDSLAELLSGLRHEKPPTEAMEAGTALHKALEVAGSGLDMLDGLDALEADGYRFEFHADAEVPLPTIQELRAEKDYEGVRVTGKADAMSGFTIYDHKSTGHFDAESYLNGYQWRFYLDIFGCDRFVWNVFEMQETKDRPKVYRVHAIHRLEQMCYPMMHDHCRRLVRDFRDFVTHNAPDLLEREELPC